MSGSGAMSELHTKLYVKLCHQNFPISILISTIVITVEINVKNKVAPFFFLLIPYRKKME